MKKAALPIILALILSLLSSCADEPAVDEYGAAIEALDYTIKGSIIYVEDLEDLLGKAHPNLIVRGKLVSRDEPEIIDYSGNYNTDFLYSDATVEQKQRVAASFLVTRYHIEVDEILLGEENLPDGDIPLDMSYGIIGDYHRRDSGIPILKVGEEYLFLLRADVLFGNTFYYLAFPPASALELSGENDIAELTEGAIPDHIFGDFADYGELKDKIGEITSELDYELAPEGSY